MDDMKSSTRDHGDDMEAAEAADWPETEPEVIGFVNPQPLPPGDPPPWPMYDLAFGIGTVAGSARPGAPVSAPFGDLDAPPTGSRL